MFRIKYLREKQGLTQTELSKILNISQSTLAKYENESRKPDISMVDKLAKHFNVSVNYIIGNVAYPSSPEMYPYKEKAKNEPKDLKKFLDQTEIMFDGEIYNLTPEEKEMVMQSLKVAFYAAKRANKRKKDALKK